MNFLQKFIAEFLLFRKSERLAIVALAVLILLTLLAGQLAKVFIHPPPPDRIDSLQIALFEKSLRENLSDSSSSASQESFNPFFAERPYSPAAKRTATMFRFDPNTVSHDSLLLLGFSEKQAAAFENFRSRGMKFYNEADLRKFRFLQEEKMEQLVRYADYPQRKAASYEKPVYTKQPESSFATVELNTADSATLEALPGIGPVLARGIVKYRDRMGGFHSVDQLNEVFGMRDSTYQFVKKFFKADTALVKRININTAATDDMRKHPLLRNPLAKTIVSYREQHGAYRKTEDLKQLPMVTDSLFEKLRPYLTVD